MLQSFMTTCIVSGGRPPRFAFACGSAQCEPVLVGFRKKVTAPIIGSHIRVTVNEFSREISGQRVGSGFADSRR